MLGKDPLLLLLLLSGPFSVAEGATGTRSGLSGQSKPAGPEREAASRPEAVPICVFCPYAHGRPHTTQLYQHVPESRWPIVYSPRYNITFMGLEKLHPFDAGKWGKVISFLKGMEGPTWTLHWLLPPPNPTAFPQQKLQTLSYLQSQPSGSFHPSCQKDLSNTDF